MSGIPVVLQDLEGWAASEGPSALRAPDTHPDLVRLLAVDAATRRNDRLLAAYRSPIPGEFEAWLAEELAAADRPVLELGAGLGHPGTVRLDLNLELLRAQGHPPPLVETHEGVALAPGAAIVADATDPPFCGSTFATVVLANLLDSCGDPALVLAHADALVQPGGQVLIGCAYAFDASITPVSAQFTEAELLAALRGEARFGEYELELRLDREPLELTWRLRAGPRTEHAHRVHTLVARRP